ncbi:hypothetical protein A9Z64_03025 [Moraxella osloensis]|uniref:RcnB family protein n=1 Tax=Faucicola osloensis TaxID=34062 RepID=A0A378QAW3_FAUOS|nr:hypothetical protein [Moraxella osloensis]AME02114.1 hypothetical protein AXE82_10395 [Moraxella osloensis]OBX51189.1 hypothetical protein A9Z64_03025 [Moraxella osloensis]QPT42140.1 hypothetical protein I6G27_09260 [Moraxella osloensis]STY97765.1 Uncharacterised protein [Moraxella osloensis]
MKKSTLLTSLFLAGSFMASPAVFADPGHGKGQDKQARTWTQHQKQQQKHYKDERKENQRYNPNHDREHDRGDNRYYDSRSGRYLTHEQYRQLPPGLQKNVARGKAVPLGWAKKLDNRYYTVKQYNDRNVYVLNNNAYRQAKVISRPRPGEVRLRVDNRVLDVIEATRVIINVL